MQQEKAIVIDNGSASIKAGFSADDAPTVDIPTLVGRPKYQSVRRNVNRKQLYLGQEALDIKGVLKLQYPMENGIINDWQSMTKIWHHTFYNQLKIIPSENSCLLTQYFDSSKNQRQRITQIMFQTFDFPQFYLKEDGVLSLYSSGRTTGLVIDSGDGATKATPVYQGQILREKTKKTEVGGRDLTKYMKEILCQVGLNLSSSAEFETIKQMKQKLGYLAIDFDDEFKKYKLQNQENCRIYELPDGQVISVKSQMFRAAQPLFKPMLIGKQLPGIHELAYSSILSCDEDMREDLYRSIVASGGCSLFTGFQERLSKQIVSLAPSNYLVRVITPSQRRYLAWIGGSILSSLSTFQQSWITKAQYQQTGPSIVNSRCI